MTAATNAKPRVIISPASDAHVDHGDLIVGRATLVSGEASVTLDIVDALSFVMASRMEAIGTAFGSITAACGPGTVAISSVKATGGIETNDNSVVNYIIVKK